MVCVFDNPVGYRLQFSTTRQASPFNIPTLPMNIDHNLFNHVKPPFYCLACSLCNTFDMPKRLKPPVSTTSTQCRDCSNAAGAARLFLPLIKTGALGGTTGIANTSASSAGPGLSSRWGCNCCKTLANSALGLRSFRGGGSSRR